MTRHKRHPAFWRTFAKPTWIALLTAVGLFAALLGDDGWDVLSWVGMAIPAWLSIKGLMVRKRV
ncbi:hypothetical protein [Pseudomonas sp. LS-2]|jgi:hypothetical protein|uniref:hypothetical protein n=1 Tax=Pseudomonas sp. LS-2 TaxID=2315859 RepID=UPI000E718DF7|nr:hypothetical protein [Pseudomonas sp. LS-2]RJX82988.1 hypothetical protein D3M70_02445 [Pseudomonas sp. LS-2]